MDIPHEVTVRALRGRLGLAAGLNGMHACAPKVENRPKCGEPRESTFRRHGMTREGRLVAWFEFKCFSSNCRVAWCSVFQVELGERLH